MSDSGGAARFNPLLNGAITTTQSTTSACAPNPLCFNPLLNGAITTTSRSRTPTPKKPSFNPLLNGAITTTVAKFKGYRESLEYVSIPC